MKLGDALDHLDHAEQTSRISRAAALAIKSHLNATIDENIRLRKEVKYLSSMSDHARRLALDLECMCLDPNGWYERALDSVCEYKADLEALFPQDPTYMGEPVLCGYQDCTKTAQSSVSD